MCPHEKMKRPRGIMDFSLFKKIVNDCKELDLSESTIFLHKEGEPFTDELIIDRIIYIKDQLPNLKQLYVSTNGSLLDEGKIVNLLNSGLDKLCVSLDATTKETYSVIRRQLDFEKVLKNVNDLIYWKKELGSKLKISLQMVVSDINKHEVEEFKKLWLDKVDQVSIKTMHSYLDGGMSSFAKSKDREQKSICFDPFNRIVIHRDGLCGVCCWDYDNVIVAGDTAKNTIQEIFNGEVFNQVRRIHEEKKCNELEPCNRCQRIFGEDKIHSDIIQNDGEEVIYNT